jgi:uncharacterized membrane protein
MVGMCVFQDDVCQDGAVLVVRYDPWCEVSPVRKEIRTMARVEKTITIDAPIEKVFEYWTEPINLLEFWPSMVEVSDVQPSPHGGSNFRWV